MPNQNEGIRLKFLDGSVIEDASCGSSGGVLWCWIPGVSMLQAAQAFTDPGKTGKIIFEYGEMSTEYDGYTFCSILMVEDDGKISVCMKKG